MKKNSAVIIVFSNGFGVAVDNKLTLCTDIDSVASFCIHHTITHTNIVINSDDQVYDHARVPKLQFIDRQLYIRQKLQQLKKSGKFAKLPGSHFLTFAGISQTDSLDMLLNQLNSIKVKVTSLRLFALEIYKFVPKQSESIIWNLVIVEHKGILYVSAFKGQQIVFYRNTYPEELKLTLDYVHHHPEYYGEEIKIYTINCNHPIQNAESLQIKDIYQQLVQSKPIVNLAHTQFNHKRLLNAANLAALCVLCYIISTQGIALIKKNKDYNELQLRQRIISQDIMLGQSQLQNLSKAQLDIILVKDSENTQNPFESEIRKIHKIVQCFAHIQRCSYVNHNGTFFVKRLVLKAQKNMLHPKQRQQIRYMIQRTIPHKTTITWPLPHEIHIMGVEK